MELQGFDAPSLPVTCVRWEDARQYAEWAGKSLPAIDEWLHAAIGGDNRSFPWGNRRPESGHLEKYAVLGRADPKAGGRPAPVCGRDEGVSPFGALDMLGNVEEWVSDLRRPGEYSTVGYSFSDPLPENMRWPVRPAEDLPGLPAQAPWIGFRCVLLLTSERQTSD